MNSTHNFLASIINLLCFAAGARAQNSALPQQSMPLWTGTIPEALGTDPVKDIPTLTPYWPAPGKASGAAMIVCPGGGYEVLAPHEGKAYALWLNERGIAAFVLKYRLGSNGYRHPAMMHDVQRAIRLVRAHAAEWGLNPDQIGIMGSSAGGHLASTALTHYDAGQPDAADPVERASSRPDLGVLCYAVITMGRETHGGSRSNLLGPNPDPADFAFLSSERHVTKDTPPCFVWTTAADQAVPAENSIVFADALQKNQVPFELHIYQNGPHGQGLGVTGYTPGVTPPGKLLPWTRALDDWLRLRHFIPEGNQSP